MPLAVPSVRVSRPVGAVVPLIEAALVTVGAVCWTATVIGKKSGTANAIRLTPVVTLTFKVKLHF